MATKTKRTNEVPVHKPVATTRAELIAQGIIVPDVTGERRRLFGDAGAPTPQRYFDEGEVLHKTWWDKTEHGFVTTTWRAPRMLALDFQGVKDAERNIAIGRMHQHSVRHGLRSNQ